jgi:hypothetical protein
MLRIKLNDDILTIGSRGFYIVSGVGYIDSSIIA